MKLFGVIALILLTIVLLTSCSANDAWHDPMYVETLYVWDAGTGTWVQASAGGGGGITDHDLLNNLDYASAGHTGFEPAIGYTGVVTQFLNGTGAFSVPSYTETDPIVKAINGIVKSNGALISAAVAGVDYLANPMTDDVALSFGTGSTSSLLWETADANANALLLGLPVSNGTDIPALVIGDINAINVDLELLDTFTFPSLNVIDTDRDSYLTLTYSADDAPMIIGNRNVQLKPNTDLDDFFTFATVSNIPTIYGTGAYLRVGDANSTSHSFSSEDDLVVSGKAEFNSNVYFDSTSVYMNSNYGDYGTLWYGGASFSIGYSAADSDARGLVIGETAGAGTYTTIVQLTTSWSLNAGLFDSVTQPGIACLDKSNKYASDTAYYSDAGAATPIMKKANEFGSSLVGDTVRITSGTNTVAGWYWITSVDSVNQVTLDRNWCTGNVPNNGNGVIYHSFTMLSAEGICTRITDGAPSDSSVEINKDGWLILDVSQANGRLYWRANNGWHYVDATAGISLPANERIDKNGHEFQIGETVSFKIDKINDDGSFHALPYLDTTKITEIRTEVKTEYLWKEPRQFKDVKELENYLSLTYAIMPLEGQNCVDCSRKFMLNALADGFLVSTEIIDNYKGLGCHMLCSTIIEDSIYYIEPQDKTFWYAMPSND